MPVPVVKIGHLTTEAQFHPHHAATPTRPLRTRSAHGVRPHQTATHPASCVQARWCGECLCGQLTA
jgi:hypothetical protein